MCRGAKPAWERAIKITFLPSGWEEWKIKVARLLRAPREPSFGSLATSRFPARCWTPARPSPPSGGRPEGWVMLPLLSHFRNSSHTHMGRQKKSATVRKPDRAGTAAAPRVVLFLFLFYWGGACDRRRVSLPARPPLSKWCGGRCTSGCRVIFKHRSMISNPYRLRRMGFPKRGLVKGCEDGAGERV